MAETVYNVFKAQLPTADQDWVADNHEVALLVGAVTINPDHATVAAVIAANTEASDGTYAREAVTGEAVVQDDANDRAELDASNADFGALDNETPTAALLYKLVTNDADSIPIAIFDTGFGAAANGAGYVVSWPNNVIRLT